MKFFKGKNKKAQLAKASEPRTQDELKKAYSQLLAQVGQAQYLAYVYGREVEQLNAALLAVNQESEQRKQLDAEVAKAEPKVEAKNE